MPLETDWLDRKNDIQQVLAFEPGATWHMRPLLASSFLPATRRDLVAEEFTHAVGFITRQGDAPDASEGQLLAHR